MRKKLSWMFAIFSICVVAAAQDYSKTRLYSFNDRVEFIIESCIHDVSTNNVTIVYFLKNNTGKSYNMQDIGSINKNTLSHCGEKGTQFIDNLGNSYTVFRHELGGQNNFNTQSFSRQINEVVLMPGILVKGELVISNIDPAARSLQLVNIGLDSRIAENSLYTVCRSYGIRNIPLYTLADFAEFERQKQLKEAQKVQAKAEKGDAASQYEMGNRYMAGQGVVENPAAALEWYRKSAMQNNIKAMKSVGDCYYTGNGIDGDYVKAFEWYEKAADSGDADAQAMAGYMLIDEHKGIISDQTKGVRYLENAALNGSLIGKVKLGQLYYVGALGEPDYQNALALLGDAANDGDKEAQFYLGLMYDWGRGVSVNKTKAAEWFQKSAAQGYLPAENVLGYYYIQGNGVKQNVDKGVELLEKAASEGFLSAYNHLGNVYYYDKYGRKNLTKAASYWKQAADKGDAEGLFNMGHLYQNGIGVLKNPQTAIEYYEKAAELGNVNAQHQLGIIHKETNNLSIALTWFEKAAENGNADAQHEAGLMYFYAKGTPKNTKKAAYFIEKAHSAGHKDAAKVWNDLELWKYK